MKQLLKYILVVALCMVPLGVNAENSEIVNDLAQDTVVNEKTDKWYKQLNKYDDVFDESVSDSLKTAMGKDYWKWAMLSGNYNSRDESIIYPGFVGFCVDVYNWADKTFNTFDSNYVVGTGKSWKLDLKSENWLDSYYLNMPNGLKTGMSSNLKSNIGINISLWGIGVGYAYNIDKLLGGEPLKQKKWDFQFNCALFSLEAFYTRNTGATNLTRVGNFSYYNIFDADYRFSGLTLESYGANLYYFVNNKKYSQSAAYSCSKFQKKSAGSMIAGISFSRHDVEIDFNKLPEDKVPMIPEYMRKYHIKYNDYCVMVGYGYNWAINKNWLFNVTAIPCLGYNHSLNDSQIDNKNMISLDMIAKMALVYNHKNFFYSVKGKLASYYFNGVRDNFFNSNKNVSFVVGYRF